MPSDHQQGAEAGEAALAGAALADGLEVALGPWLEACVHHRAAEAFGVDPQGTGDLAAAAARRATAAVVPQLRALLSSDVDAQSTTPLSLVRAAVPYATEVLRTLGVPPVARDVFQASRFPDDVYGLVPPNLAALGEEVGELALRWGAAKAWEHRRRHGTPSA